MVLQRLRTRMLHSYNTNEYDYIIYTYTVDSDPTQMKVRCTQV